MFRTLRKLGCFIGFVILCMVVFSAVASVHGIDLAKFKDIISLQTLGNSSPTASCLRLSHLQVRPADQHSITAEVVQCGNDYKISASEDGEPDQLSGPFIWGKKALSEVTVKLKCHLWNFSMVWNQTKSKIPDFSSIKAFAGLNLCHT